MPGRLQPKRLCHLREELLQAGALGIEGQQFLARHGRIKGASRHQLDQIIHSDQWQPVRGSTGYCSQLSLHQIAYQIRQRLAALVPRPGLRLGQSGRPAQFLAKYGCSFALSASRASIHFGGTDSTNGFGVRIKDFANGLLSASGAVTNKTNAVKKALDTNSTEQTKISNRATLVEERLKKQYSALDTKMASLTALNNYVAQQVTTWNKSTS